MNDPRSTDCRTCGTQLAAGTGGWNSDAALLEAGHVRVVFGSRHGARVVDGEGFAPTASPFDRRGDADPKFPPDLRPEATSAVWNLLDGGARFAAIVAEPGAGATTLLARIRASAGEHGFPERLTMSTPRGPAADIEQHIAAALDGPKGPRFYAASEIERIADGRRCLILIDGADLKSSDAAALVRRFHAASFVVAGSQAVSGFPAVTLGPLTAPAVLTQLEAGGARCADPENARAALALCMTAGAQPAGVRRVIAAAREFGSSFISLQLHFSSGAEILAALVAALPPVETRIVAILALAQAPLAAHQIAYIIRRGEIRGALDHLMDCELIRAAGPETYELANDVAPVAAASDDGDAFARIVGVFCDLCDSAPAVPLLDRHVTAAEDLLQRGARQARWRYVLALGPRLATQLALRGAAGAWGRVLTVVENGALRAGDAGALRLARHDLGVRALLLGENARAASLLQSVAHEREAAGDAGGAAASTLMAALAEQPAPRLKESADFAAAQLAPGADDGRNPAPALSPPAVPSRPRLAASLLATRADRAAGARTWRSRRARFLVLLGSGIAAVALAATTLVYRPPAGPSEGAASSASVARSAAHEPVADASVQQRAPAPTIAAFYASPARIHAGGSTQLCYTVTGAELLRIVPRVAKLTRLHSCQTITLHDAHRYRYALSAFGPDGGAVTRRLHVDVVAPAPAHSPAKRSPRLAAGDGLPRRAIYQFDATPSVVVRGQATSLCVGVGRPARGFVTHVGALPPGITRCYRVQPRKTTVYRLYVALQTETTMQTVTVAVRPAARGHETIVPRHYTVLPTR